MRLSKVSLALIAAGVGAGLATGYTHLDSLSVGAAHAATPHLAMVAPTAISAAATVTTAGLPDFTALVERAGASVVNISTFHAKGKGGPDQEDNDEESQYDNSSSASAPCRMVPACARSNRRAAWVRVSS